ncbi:heavy metal translocating P-type ATPase [Patescibacteria group bacterium]|nr:heavy metal translocating P-type ATPase [Patescibacteria group bacterium]
MSKTITLRITGMTCASCVLHIENDLKELDGIEEAVVNLPLKNGSVTFDPNKLGEKEILAAIKKAGYTAVVVKEGHGHHGHGGDSGDHAGHAQMEDRAHINDRFWKLMVAFVLSVIILSLGFIWKIDYGMEIMMVLSLIIILYSGRDFFKRGIPDLLKGRPAMDTLVALGVGAAFTYSTYFMLFTDKHEEYFMDVAIITTFILLGRYLEARAKGKASGAIRKLLELSAKIAHRIVGGKIEDIPADQVQMGDKLRVKPGEKIPTDGIILEGYGAFDESMVTGESIPVDKGEGDKVIGATINGNTTFTMEATKVGADTVLSQIIKMVQEAQMHKAPIQKLVDIVAGYFVWGVIAIATITFIGWTIVSGGITSAAFIPTVAVLIIACPCALGLATPISIVVGSGKGAQLGILIKKPESLEKTHKITAICFDKTGTITKGHPEVQEFKTLSGDEKRALSISSSLEEHSEHPLAKSVINYSKSQFKGEELKVINFRALTGLGVKGEIDGKIYHLGSSKYMEELGVVNDASAKLISDWQGKGYTVLSLSDDNKIIAVFGVQDGVKETSRKAIDLLKKRGIRTVMLTGDNEKVANKIATDVGIDEVHSGVTPDKKKEIIKQLQKEGMFVAMVGDGINDSPALAQSDVGIAMGTGTDVAMETGDLVLVKGDLMKAVEAIELSRATLRNIKQNLFWAFIYNSIGIPLAALGFLSPALSAVAMSFSSVSVVLNALRLKRFKA